MGGGGNTTTTQRTELDPRMNDMLWGTESRTLKPGVQPTYAMGNWVDTGPGGMEWRNDAASDRMTNPDSDYEITKTPGIVDHYRQIFEAGQNGANYAGLNPTQTGALNAQAEFLGGQGALAGYNAQNAVGNYLVNNLLSGQSGGNSMPTSHSVAGSYGVGGPVYGRDAMPTAAAVPQVQSDGGYQDAMSQILSGQANNPMLGQISQDIANTTTQNLQRNVLPGIRSGAALAGGYGGSRQGVAEGLAISDMNNQLIQAQNQLYGQAHEAAQGRMAQMTGQLSAQDLAAQQANAANSLAAQGQANDWLLGNRGIDAQMANASASMANAAANRDVSMARLAFDQNQANIANALTGAGVLGSAAQIPLQNMQGLYNVGTTFQGDQQNQLDAPFNNLGRFSGSLLPWSGLNATQVNTAPGGGGNMVGGAMGGALAGGQLGTMFAGGAANAAATGSMLGPWGALAGALVGAAASRSSRTYKNRITTVDVDDVLRKVGALEVDRWRYKPEIDDARVEHIGPYAEDFQESFGLGDGKSIPTVDALGVLFAAVKALAAKVEQLERRSTEVIDV